ncbi:lysM domain protein, partial [Chlamydia psittaci 08DC60]
MAEASISFKRSIKYCFFTFVLFNRFQKRH